MSKYTKYILRCLELAKKGEYYVAPNPMVGAVLASADGKIIAEGWHQRFGEGHAEVNCFANAQSQGIIDFQGCTLFVNLEPCSHYGKTPPCAKLIIEKKVTRVVVGMLDPNPMVSGKGVKMLQDAGIEVIVGVEEEKCRDLNKRFVTLHEKHRPYVILKWAQTADGFIDYKRQSSAQPVLKISTPLTKHLVHQMRAENMAIMVGTRTALLDNPSLLNRRWAGRHPIRILLDRHSIVPQDYKIFSQDAPTIVYRDNTCWQFVLQDLANRNIHSVVVEGGAKLLNTILDSGIYDEVHVEVAPIRINEGVEAPRVALGMPKNEIDGNLFYEWYHF